MCCTFTFMFEGCGQNCDKINSGGGSPDWKGAGWYRFTGGAGTRITEQPPGPLHCGTGAPGWVNGTHTSNPGEERKVQICFDWGGDKCWQ